MKSYVVAGLMLCTLAACGGNTQDTQSTKAEVRMSLRQGAAQPVANVQEVGDTLQVYGYFTNYQIIHNADGTTALTNTVDGTSTAYASTLKTIKFADRFVSFDLEGVPGQAYRLYQAAFNRKPDLPGLGFWTMAMQNGVALNNVAAGFTGSAEFQKSYGSVSDSQFVTLLYNNVLHRAPEQAGYDFWVNGIKNGASRESVLAQFSESAENKSNVATDIGNGIVYEPHSSALKVIPVLRSSFENKTAAGKAIGPQLMPPEVAESNAVAFADFFQEGDYSMVTHSLEYDYTPATATKYGHIKFYKKIGDQWVDTTTKLLSDTTGCLHPRKAIVADFNGDGKPDVFFACHGFDADTYPGEQPHVLLSQADGKYKNVTLPDNCYCHSASAADVKGNGFAEILVTDNMQSKKPFFFANKNGTLTRDNTRFGDIYSQPNDGSIGYPGVSYGTPAIYTAELIDFYGTGHFDAFLAGTAPDNVWGDWAPAIFRNDGSGKYTQANSVRLPYDKYFESTLDIVFENGTVYLTSVHENNMKGAETYGFSNIAKIDLATLKWTQIYANTSNYSNGHGWLNWIIPFQGKIVSQSAAYGVSVPQQ